MPYKTRIQTIRIENLRRLVSEYDTQAKFARAHELDPSYISQLLSGHRGFGERSARNIEEKLNLKPGALDNHPGHQIEDEANTEDAYVTSNTRMVPVISWVQAGEWTEAIDIFSPGYGESYEETEACAGPHSFWLRVKGDSMTSPVGLSVPEGYLIRVEPDSTPENGSLVIAKLENQEEATFKKLVIDAGNKYLKPLNPDHKIIHINGNCRIVGVVKEIRLKL